MDGLTFLEKLMRLRPMPVLMISSLTERGSEAALRALELGAIDFLPKPKMGIADGLREYADTIAEKFGWRIRRAGSSAYLRPVRLHAPLYLPWGRVLVRLKKLLPWELRRAGRKRLKNSWCVCRPMPRGL